MSSTFRLVLLCALVVWGFSAIGAQTKNNYNHAAQQKLVPAELGKVYLGMPLADFVKQIDASRAEIDVRFEVFSIDIPFQKGNITNLVVKIHGLSGDEKKMIIAEETVTKKDEFGGEYEDKVTRLKLDKIPTKGFVYAMYITFKKDFDLKSYVIKIYGKDGELRKAGDEYHLFDIQWTKKTADGLTWLIRSFHEGDDRSLQLLGRINGTEWEIEGF